MNSEKSLHKVHENWYQQTVDVVLQRLGVDAESGLSSAETELLTILATIALQLLVVYTPWLQQIFRTSPLDAVELSVCFLFSTVLLLAVEAEKWMIRRGWIYT